MVQLVIIRLRFGVIQFVQHLADINFELENNEKDYNLPTNQQEWDGKGEEHRIQKTQTYTFGALFLCWDKYNKSAYANGVCVDK